MKQIFNDTKTQVDTVQKSWETLSISTLKTLSKGNGSESKSLIIDLATIKTILLQKRPTIFLSYCWSQKADAIEIESALQENNINVVRDEKELSYMDDLMKFMKRVRTTTFVLLLISKEYLESRNCMNEILELRKDDNYKNKIMLVVHPNANIYGSTGAIPYIKYWNKKLKELEEAIEGLTLEEAGELGVELKQLRTTKNEIVNFIQNDIRFQLVPPLSDLKQDRYLPILQRIVNAVTNIK